MSTEFEAFCNATTDLFWIEPDIDQYDQKRILTPNWAVDSGSRYILENSGHIDQLYAAGTDLGAAQASAAACDTNSEWFYNTSTDAVVYYDSATAPNAQVMSAGRDWATLKTAAINRASDFVRNAVNKPILPRIGTQIQSETLRDYEDVIIRSTSIMACFYLIQPYDREKALAIRNEAYDPELKLGYLDQIKAGILPLWNETSNQQAEGVLVNVTKDATTTGSIIRVRGEASVDYDLIDIKIVTGDTMVSGSASTGTYSSWVKDTTGFGNTAVAVAVVISGGWQAVGDGMYVMFGQGLYVANDHWTLEVSGSEIEAGTRIKSYQAVK